MMALRNTIWMKCLSLPRSTMHDPLSLFASKRVIWLARAESALPRGKAGGGRGAERGSDDEETTATGGDADALTSYLREPTPDVVLVIDSARYKFEGEDKARK